MRSDIMFSNNLLPFSVSQFKPKLCIDCKFYKNNFFTNSKFGKCSLFLKEENQHIYLVNGISEYQNIEYYYCATARNSEDMCGKEGKMHKRKYIKKVFEMSKGIKLF
jgi:hypothetical protein